MEVSAALIQHIKTLLTEQIQSELGITITNSNIANIIEFLARSYNLSEQDLFNLSQQDLQNLLLEQVALPEFVRVLNTESIDNLAPEEELAFDFDA